MNAQMDHLRSNYKTLHTEKELSPIHFSNSNKIRVGYGRGVTCWKLDFEKNGEISVKRCMKFTDWLLVAGFTLIDVMIFLLLFYSGITVKSILFFFGIVLFQVLLSYYLYVTGPLKQITRFVEKYLGV